MTQRQSVNPPGRFPALVMASLAAITGFGSASPAHGRPGGGAPGQAEPATQQETAPTVELTLQEAIETALRQNLSVRIGRIGQEVASEAIEGARGIFDPNFTFDLPQPYSRNTRLSSRQLEGGEVVTTETLGASAAVTEQLVWGTRWTTTWFASRSDSSDMFTLFNPVLSSTLALNVSQPLLRGFGTTVNRQPIVVAQTNYERSRQQFRDDIQQVAMNTYRAYWNLAMRNTSRGVREDALELAEQQLERNRRLARLGGQAPIQIIQAEQQVAQRRVDLLRARNDLEDAEDALKRLLNVEDVPGWGWDVGLVPSDEPEYNVPEIDVEQAIATAMNNDPGLLQARVDVRDRELSRQVAWNGTLPDLELTAGLTLRGQGGNRIIRDGLGGEITGVEEGGLGDALRQIVHGDFRNWSVGLSLSFPLFNRAAESAHARAVLDLESAELRVRDLEQQIEVDIRGAVRGVASLAEQVTATQLTRELAEQQLEAAELQYEIGTGDNFELLQFQQALTDARTQELQAIIDFNNALAELELTKGTLLDMLGIGISDAGRSEGGEQR